MSYEGYHRMLCSTGHLTELDVYDNDEEVCPICKKKFVWSETINTTNGVDEENSPTKLKQKSYETVILVDDFGDNYRIKRPLYKTPLSGKRK